jgi:O-acetylserine/cysteine efflux transporter
MSTTPRLKGGDLAAVSAVVLVWGLNFVVMKIGLAHFTPFQLGAGRFLFAFLPLALLLRHPGVPVRWMLAFGLAQGVGQFGLLFLALHVGMTAALASVLLQIHVFFSAALGATLLKERVGQPLIVGLCFAAAGLACFAVHAITAGSAGGVTTLGLMLTVAAAFMWAVSNIIVRLAQRHATSFAPTSFVAWSSASSIIPFLALSWWFDPPGSVQNWLDAPWQGWAAVAFLGWVATNLGYGLWTTLLKKFPASRVAPFSLGVPLIGLTAGVLLLNESMQALQWAGSLLVLCALVCVVGGVGFRGPR